MNDPDEKCKEKVQKEIKQNLDKVWPILTSSDQSWQLQTKGSFINHVDKILTIFDHPPTSNGRPWTYQWPPTYVHVDIHVPTSWNQSICTLKFRSLMKVVILFVIYNRGSKTCALPILMMLGSGPNLGDKFLTKKLSLTYNFWKFGPQSFWHFVHMDIWATTYLLKMDNSGHLANYPPT